MVASFKRKLLAALHGPLADCLKTPSEPYGHFLDSIRIFFAKYQLATFSMSLIHPSHNRWGFLLFFFVIIVLCMFAQIAQ
ncbi:MAG: hypothetical protein WBO82_08095 [Neisseria sp.]|jgi:hypothetical protein